MASASSPAAWRVNYAALLLAQLVSSATFGLIVPFLPLYLLELGQDRATAVVWVGAISSAMGVMQLLANPLWGVVADRFGRKPVVLRALVGTTIFMGALFFTGAAWQVFAIRVLQGALSAPDAALLALAASIVPTPRMGAGLGLLQTVQFLGSSLAPLIGGLAAARLGYRGTFLIASGMALLNTISVLVLVREPARPVAERAARSRAEEPMRPRVSPAVLRSTAVQETRPRRHRGNRSLFGRVSWAGLIQGLGVGLRVPTWRAAILATVGFQVAYTVGFVLLPLQVAGTARPDEAAAAVGWVIAANGTGVAVGAAALGWLTGRVTARQITVLALVSAGLVSIPLARVDAIPAFVVLRFALGFCIGGVLPSLRATIAQAARGPHDEAHLGSVYGLSASALAGGAVIAAPLAALVAATLDVPSVNLVGAAVWFTTAVFYGLASARAAQPVPR